MDTPQTPEVRIPGEAPGTPQPALAAPASEVNNVTATQSSTEVEMGGTQDATSQPEPEKEKEDAIPPDVQAQPAPTPAKKSSFSFLDFLTSPIVEIIVGEGENETVMTAHQSLLLEAPLLAELVNKFEGAGSRRINLPAENVDAFGCFLQFQYTRDCSIPQSDTPSNSEVDKSEEDMLRHARIYTLAEKLGLPNLKSLAHSKIHKIKGTPGAELAYARDVYTHTSAEDTAIRRPVAAHWANQSHVLRHEVGDDFKKLCIEVPQFAFDVLTIILDRKEKSSAADDIKGSARKRSRREI